MAENLFIPENATKKQKYEAIVPQIKTLLENETDVVANLANVVAVLKETFSFFWVGFYLVKENQLVLAPFQGSMACTRIPFHKGVCGACYTQQATLIVPNVEDFAGHIACSSLSKSEIVVPIFAKNTQNTNQNTPLNIQKHVVGVLDVDSDLLDDFDQDDKEGLEKIVALVAELF